MLTEKKQRKNQYMFTKITRLLTAMFTEKKTKYQITGKKSKILKPKLANKMTHLDKEETLHQPVSCLYLPVVLGNANTTRRHVMEERKNARGGWLVGREHHSCGSLHRARRRNRAVESDTKIYQSCEIKFGTLETWQATWNCCKTWYIKWKVELFPPSPVWLPLCETPGWHDTDIVAATS